MSIEKLEEFAKDGDKNLDNLDVSQGFLQSEKPERQWFNDLFNKITKKTNEVIDYTDGVIDDVSAQKLDTGITATPQYIGSVARTQADVNSDVVSIKSFGAIGNGLYNNTAAFSAAIAELPIDANIYLGDGSDTYLLDNVSNILNSNYTGNAVLLVSGNSFYIGTGWLDKANTIYVASSGISTDSGLSPINPTDLTTGFNLIKKYAAINPNINWRLKLAAGTYPNSDSRRFEEFPHTQNAVIIEGAEEEGSTAVPTTIFDGWTVNVFRALRSEGLNLIFRNLKMTNSSMGLVFIRGSGNIVWGENIHGYDNTGEFYVVRGGFAEFHGGVVDNCEHGVIFQQVYGSVGDSGIQPAGKFTNNTGVAVQISRGSICYVNRCEFENNDVHIQQSRHSRVRTQSNQFGSFTTAAIQHETAFCLWNNNPAELDTFTTIPFGKSPLVQVAGSHVSSTSKSSELSTHLQYIGEAINITGTTRIEPENQLSPFRMPAFWMKSRTAQARVEYEIALPIAETVTIEITGENSTSVLASITLNPTTFSRALVSFELTGATRPSSTKGRYSAIARGDNINAASFGDTYTLTDSVVTGSSVDEMRYRLYVKRSVGTGNMIIYRMLSATAY